MKRNRKLALMTLLFFAFTQLLMFAPKSDEVDEVTQDNKKIKLMYNEREELTEGLGDTTYNYIDAGDKLTALFYDTSLDQELTKKNLNITLATKNGADVSAETEVQFEVGTAISEGDLTYYPLTFSSYFSPNKSPEVYILKITYSPEPASPEETPIVETYNYQFVVDSEAPTAKLYAGDKDISNDAGYVFSNSNLKLDIKDNYNIQNLKISVNNQDVTDSLKIENGTEYLLPDSLFNDDGQYQILVNASDFANNKLHDKVFYVRKDTTNAEIVVSGVTARSNNDQNINVKINDVNMKSAVAYINGNKVASCSDNNGGREMSFTVSKEGTYKLYVESIDYSDEKATYTDFFVIDKTAPKFSINRDSINSNNFTNMSYQPNITMHTDNFNNDDYISSIVINNVAYSPYNVPVFSAEGTYNVNLEVSDRAGNSTPGNFSFTIDKTLPKVDFSGIVNNFYYNKAVSANINITDSNLLNSSRLLNGKDYSNGKAIKAEGEYEVTGKGSDKADNLSSKTLLFHIDKTSPKVTISGISNGDTFNSIVKPIIDINETNSNTIMLLNGVQYHGEEIATDGEYTLVIKTTDNAGNISEQTLRFILDRTSPEILLTGIKNNKTYTDSIKPEFKCREDVTFKATLNGKTYASGTEVKEPGEYTLLIQATDKAGNVSEQTVKFTILSGKDAERYIQEGGEPTIKPEADKEESFFAANKGPLVAGASVGLIAILTITIVTVVKGKK